MIPHISAIPQFTDEDKKTLEKMKGSEVFLIVAKILAKEWHTTTTQMLGCAREDLVQFQGHARALVSVYNQLMLYANVDVPEKQAPDLQVVRKLRNIKE